MQVVNADLEDLEVEAAWREHAMYAPPEDLDRWLHQLRNPTSKPPSKGAASHPLGLKRMTRHHSHNSTAPLDTITSSKRQQSMPVPARKRAVFAPDHSRMWEEVHASYGPHASKRGSPSARITQHTAARTSPASRWEDHHTQRRSPHSSNTSPSNPARVAAAATAAAAAFGSAITLPSPDRERSTSTRGTPLAAGAQAELEGDHTTTHTVNSHRSGSGSPAQPDVFVFERPSPFLPPMREPTCAPMHVPHASKVCGKYPTFLRAPASEGSAAGRGLQCVPSFKEWGATDSVGMDVVDECAASVWAAGCMLFEMLYGYHPFEMEAGETVDEWVAKVRSFDVRWPESGTFPTPPGFHIHFYPLLNLRLSERKGT